MGWNIRIAVERNSQDEAARDRTFKKAFYDAARQAGSADRALSTGGLDGIESGMFLTRAFGIGMYTVEPLSAFQVRQLVAGAIWEKPRRKELHLMWAYHSARHFAEACIELGLGVQFNL